ncbi:hypothetical protein NQD34_009254 [Periophthalmus magnuspinnatus]|nr:hypothetical protein NQD34_009254 [Periophthalmus magnuspinnatus]
MKYPADLAHKIRSANHMTDDDGAELDTPINYSLKYSDEQLNSGRQSPSLHGNGEQQEEERTKAPRGYSDEFGLKYAVENPALKYGAETQRKDEYGLKYNAPKESNASVPKLRPLQQPAANRGAPKSHQESTQTYCVEDTPICFSRGSSLSSLSSEDDEAHEVLPRKRRGGSVVDGGERNSSNYPTLPVSEKPSATDEKQHKEAESQTATESAASNSRSKRHHHHETRHHHHETRHHHAPSGARTPKSPPEPAPLYAQETPLMFSRCTSVSSLDSFSTSSIASSVRSSEPCSGVPSGEISPSDLPDSPGQTMPPSRAKTPPPPKAEKVEELTQKLQRQDEQEPSSDLLLHFATESTPHGFSKASSLSALSVDEPYIGDLKVGGGAEPEKQEPLLAGESDDDIEILEACINMAMPKSSRKPKKQPPQAPPPVSAQPIRKPSQLPVYKLLPPQSRLQAQPRKDKPEEEAPSDDVPRVYCVEGTPLNFSTATSLSDLTIESPPPEEAAPPHRRRAGLPEGENGDDILAECISAAMPKSKLRKPAPARPMGEQSLQAPPSLPSLPPQATPPLAAQQQKKKPTSPVKPQLRPPVAALKQTNKPGFSFDSPRHYTPIEGTPCCFSRNDSLSSLDFDEDEEKPKDFSIEDTPVCFSRNSSLSSLSDIDHENNNKAPPTAAPEAPPPTSPCPHHTATSPKRSTWRTRPSASPETPLSSLSIDSEDDLLQECISSAMPKKKKKAPPPNTSNAPPTTLNVPPTASNTPPTTTNASNGPPLSHNAPLPPEDTPIACTDPAPSSDPAPSGPSSSAPQDEGILSELEPCGAPRSPVSPDSESFDWKAIQEGANSIVSSLNAAAAASLSRQPSSDSDSVLSLKSVGSPFRLPPKPKAPEAPDAADAPQPERRERRKESVPQFNHGKPRSEHSARGRTKPRAAIGPKPGSNADDRTGSSSRDSTPSRSQRPKPTLLLHGPFKPAVKPKTAGLPRSESAPCVTPKKQKSDAEKPPALVRQSTFIKEAPSPTLKRKLEESQVCVAPDSLSSPETQQPPPNRKTDVSRSHSESPSRPQEVTSRFSRTGTWKRENSSANNGTANGKQHSTSLPRVGTWKRTGSSSSVLSASSESSERGASDRGRSEEEVTSQRKGTWRKKKSDSVERSFSDRSDKSEDVWVRLEDCPVNNPRSASSCSARSPSNAPPVIDSPGPASRIPSGSSSCSNLNLRRSCESLDEKPPRVTPRGAVAAE